MKEPQEKWNPYERCWRQETTEAVIALLVPPAFALFWLFLLFLLLNFVFSIPGAIIRWLV